MCARPCLWGQYRLPLYVMAVMDLAGLLMGPQTQSGPRIVQLSESRERVAMPQATSSNMATAGTRRACVNCRMEQRYTSGRE